jgi:hypothetical protein
VLLPLWRDELFPFLIETLGIKTTMAYHLVISDGFGQSEIKENYAQPAGIAFSTFHKKPGKVQCKKILTNSDQCKETLTTSDSRGMMTDGDSKLVSCFE